MSKNVSKAANSLLKQAERLRALGKDKQASIAERKAARIAKRTRQQNYNENWDSDW